MKHCVWISNFLHPNTLVIPFLHSLCLRSQTDCSGWSSVSSSCPVHEVGQTTSSAPPVNGPSAWAPSGKRQTAPGRRRHSTGCPREGTCLGENHSCNSTRPFCEVPLLVVNRTTSVSERNVVMEHGEPRPGPLPRTEDSVSPDASAGGGGGGGASCHERYRPHPVRAGSTLSSYKNKEKLRPPRAHHRKGAFCSEVVVTTPKSPLSSGSQSPGT